MNRGVPLVQLDEKFTFYANIMNELQQLPTYYDVQCIRINLKPLLDTICQHAQQWRTKLGEKLAERTIVNMDKMRFEIKVSICRLGCNFLEEFENMFLYNSNIISIYINLETFRKFVKNLYEFSKYFRK